MANRSKNGSHTMPTLEKSLTGIKGLDQITGGGLPKGRTTIVCGGPGCGKTMLGIEFLVRGATESNEPGVLIAFEETPHEMAANVSSLGFDIEDLARRKKLYLDYVYVDPSEIQEAGDYDLEGLFVRLQSAVEAVGAKRVMLDTVEALFSSFSNQNILRAEIRRLFRWLKDRNLTTIITAERGEGSLTRYGLEEYVSDCVITLDHRITDQISTRRLRVVKYRGTSHGADEYPFLIDETGISVLPLTSLELKHKASTERMSSGIPDLDDMLGGEGYFRGSSVLLSGTAGAGKSTTAALFAEAACKRGERCLYIGFEESSDQVVRNLKSVGVDLQPHLDSGLLVHEAWRPTQFGIEMHLLRIHKLVEQYNPDSVVVDPITNLIGNSDQKNVYSLLMRLMDFLKQRGTTAIFVSLTKGGESLEHSDVGISSLADTWILLRDVELNGERNRCIYVLKSRGMSHSNQLREFVMSSRGIQLLPVYLGEGGVLTGSARAAQAGREQAESAKINIEKELRHQELAKKRRALDARMESLKAEFEVEEAAVNRALQQEAERERQLQNIRDTIARARGITEPHEKSVPAGKSR